MNNITLFLTVILILIIIINLVKSSKNIEAMTPENYKQTGCSFTDGNVSQCSGKPGPDGVANNSGIRCCYAVDAKTACNGPQEVFGYYGNKTACVGKAIGGPNGVVRDYFNNPRNKGGKNFSCNINTHNMLHLTPCYNSLLTGCCRPPFPNVPNGGPSYNYFNPIGIANGNTLFMGNQTSYKGFIRPNSCRPNNYRDKNLRYFDECYNNGTAECPQDYFNIRKNAKNENICGKIDQTQPIEELNNKKSVCTGNFETTYNKTSKTIKMNENDLISYAILGSSYQPEKICNSLENCRSFSFDTKTNMAKFYTTCIDNNCPVDTSAPATTSTFSRDGATKTTCTKPTQKCPVGQHIPTGKLNCENICTVSGEHFDIDSKKCITCPSGEHFDIDSNKCISNTIPQGGGSVVISGIVPDGTGGGTDPGGTTGGGTSTNFKPSDNKNNNNIPSPSNYYPISNTTKINVNKNTKSNINLDNYTPNISDKMIKGINDLFYKYIYNLVNLSYNNAINNNTNNNKVNNLSIIGNNKMAIPLNYSVYNKDFNNNICKNSFGSIIKCPEPYYFEPPLNR